MLVYGTRATHNGQVYVLDETTYNNIQYVADLNSASQHGWQSWRV